MIKKLLCITIIMLVLKTKAQQNLVPNGSFETYTACPSTQGQVTLCAGWQEVGSADYFNYCSSNPSFSVPTNWGGFQQPSSGNSYCAIGVYLTHSLGNNVREFIQAQLTSSLLIGTKYFVSFKTSLSISPSIQVNCAIKKIGALFTVNQADFIIPIANSYTPQVKSNNYITDTLSWVQIFGSFIADSAYNNISLGNFYVDSATDTLIMNGSNTCSSYYYIDDICVSTDSIFTKQYQFVGIDEQKSSSEIELFFNSSIDKVIVNNQSKHDFNIKLYNSSGQLTFSCIIFAYQKIAFSIQNYASGIYYVEINNKYKTITKKIIKL